jgi:hypothetical protein
MAYYPVAPPALGVIERCLIGRPSDDPGRIARFPRVAPMLADARDERRGTRPVSGT